MLNQPGWLYLDSVNPYFPTLADLLTFKMNAFYPHDVKQDWPVRLELSSGEAKYHCDICGLSFVQWLTIDPEYRRMPDTLWDAVICLDCYRFICYRNGSAPQGVVQRDIDHKHLSPMTARQDKNHRANVLAYGQEIIRVATHKFTPKMIRDAVNASRRRNADRIRI